MAQALLLVTLHPQPSEEEEFNDWYDLEHLPQRLAMPGILNGTRWVCVEGWPRYMAMYDLESLGAVETPEYNAVSGANSTPWTRRVIGRALGRRRVVAERLDGGTGASVAPETARLLLARYTGLSDSAARALAERRPAGLARAAVFREGEDVWLLASFSRPVPEATLLEYAEAEGRGALTFNLYVPYRREA